jgi:hypothetical protein
MAYKHWRSRLAARIVPAENLGTLSSVDPTGYIVQTLWDFGAATPSADIMMFGLHVVPFSGSGSISRDLWRENSNSPLYARAFDQDATVLEDAIAS